METMISACGLVCSRCDAYRATKAGDDAALERVVSDWKARYNIPELRVEHVRCMGCMTESEPKCDHCGKHCGIRKCVVGKGLSTCAQCGDFPCAELSGFYAQMENPSGKSVLAMMTALREVEHGMHSAI